MAIDTPSKDYKAQSGEWAKIRALSGGVDKAREYVTALPGMNTDRANDFKARAYYLPALPRTVEIFGGLIFLRDPQTKAPTALDPYREDVTLTGLSFDGLASWAVSEVIEVGRVAVHVDFPDAPAGLTKAEAEARGLRAYARIYETESILSAEYGYFGGVRKLSRVRLKERVTKTDPATFEETEIERVRVLVLDGGFYTQQVWEKSGEEWVLASTVRPIRNGAPLDYLPIFFMSHRDHDATPIRPPLSDLADVSVSHLNSAALREWGEMWTANPTPWFAGVQAQPTNERGETDGSTYRLNLGSSEAILLQKEGKAGFLEFGGQGMDAIGATLDRKEKHMAALGTRILLDDPRQAIAAETARIQSAGQNSMLGRISSVASAMLTQVLREVALWAGASSVDQITVSLNRNFVPAGMSPEKIKALLAAVQAGEMSSQAFFRAMQAADEIDPAKDWEEELFEREEDADRIAARGGAGDDPAAGA